MPACECCSTYNCGCRPMLTKSVQAKSDGYLALLLMPYVAVAALAIGIWLGIHYMDMQICPLRATPEAQP